MSKSKKIADHDRAVSAYLKELLSEENNNQKNHKSKLNFNYRAEAFQALLIDIQGLQIAIPTDHIASIITWPHKTTVTQKPDWYITDYEHGHQLIRVVNTSQIIFPADYPHSAHSADFIVVIANQAWGLSCNKVNNIATLAPDTVMWRETPGQRAWLAGIIPQQNCSILNIEALIAKLESESVNL